MNADEHRIKTDVFAICDQGKIVLVYCGLYTVWPLIPPALRCDIYLINIVFILVEIFLNCYGAFVRYY